MATSFSVLTPIALQTFEGKVSLILPAAKAAKGLPVFGRQLAPELHAQQQCVDPPHDVWQVLAEEDGMLFEAVDETQLWG